MRHSSLFWMSLQWGWDEQDNGYPLLMTLPVMRKTYVIGKYIFGLLFGGGAWLIAVAIMLPFQFKFGSERGRIVLLLAFSAGILCGQLSYYGEKRVLDEKEEFQSPLFGAIGILFGRYLLIITHWSVSVLAQRTSNVPL